MRPGMRGRAIGRVVEVWRRAGIRRTWLRPRLVWHRTITLIVEMRRLTRIGLSEHRHRPMDLWAPAGCPIDMRCGVA